MNDSTIVKPKRIGTRQEKIWSAFMPLLSLTIRKKNTKVRTTIRNSILESLFFFHSRLDAATKYYDSDKNKNLSI